VNSRENQRYSALCKNQARGRQTIERGNRGTIRT
jgi:hypothetical protein